LLIHEVTDSTYETDLMAEIKNLLIAVKIEGYTEIKTKGLIDDLNSQGFSVDLSTITSLVDQLPMINTINKDKITLSSDGLDTATSPNVDRNRVEQLATKKSIDDIRDT
jgi:hypothetical protein